MKKVAGSGLVDYVVPTAIVGMIVGLALYNIFTDNSIVKFLSASINGSPDYSAKEINVNSITQSNPLTGGSLGGSPTDPVQNCTFNTCTIDYGEFILTGIPADINDFTEAAGTSGGTEAIIALLHQLSDQLDQNGDSEGSEKFEDLANLVHFIAEIERQIENKAKGCINEADPKGCFQDELQNSTFEGNVPPEIADMLTGFDPNASLYDLRTYSRLGLGRNNQVYNTAAFNSNKDKNPSYAAIDVLDSILTDGDFSDTLKAVTATLTQGSEALGFKHNTFTTQLTSGNGMAFFTNQFDVITGDSDEMVSYNATGDMNVLIEPQISLQTDLQAALMCAAGGDITSGDLCLQSLNEPQNL